MTVLPVFYADGNSSGHDQFFIHDIRRIQNGETGEHGYLLFKIGKMGASENNRFTSVFPEKILQTEKAAISLHQKKTKSQTNIKKIQQQ